MLVFIECAALKTNRSGEEASLFSFIYLFVGSRGEEKEKLHPTSHSLIAPAVKNEPRSSSMRRHFNPSVYTKLLIIYPGSGSARKINRFPQ